MPREAKEAGLTVGWMGPLKAGRGVHGDVDRPGECGGGRSREREKPGLGRKEHPRERGRRELDRMGHSQEGGRGSVSLEVNSHRARF